MAAIPRVIAELGCNHRGSFETAQEMVIVAAAFCKVDVVKFQKRNPRELLTAEEYDRPHPNPALAYGATYGAHREALELSLDHHRQLKALCEQNGVTYGSSVWDLTSAREIISLAPRFIKVPSACNLNKPLLSCLAEQFDGQIHVSLGMTSRSEQARLVAFFEERGRAADLVLYACTSAYPVGFEDVCLLDIERLRQEYGRRVAGIGFSGHHLGIAVDVAAMTLGAVFVERHMTLDRTWKGTDHAASLEPDGVRKLVRDLRNVGRTLCAKPEGILPVEHAQRHKLKISQIKWTP